MDLGIRGRHAIVCAASQGLGRACAESLAREGCDLTIMARTPGPLEEAAEAIRRTYGVRVTAVAGDVNSDAGHDALLAACPAPDILVNNNGGPPFRDFRQLDREAILAGVSMNMVVPIELIQRVLDGMTGRGFGRIVNITSLSVKMPVPGLDLSSGARAGLTAFVSGIARTVADRNVTINNLLPGYFDTKRMRGGITAASQRGGISETEAEEQLRTKVPAKRFGSPEEFGNACAFLCSAHAGYITGQSLLLDGGLYPAAF